MSKRDVSPLLKILRNFLLGRRHVTALRFQQDIASRSPNPPNLPEGPHHILSANYYYPRDVRREVKPPTILAGEGSLPQITAPAPDAPKLISQKTPGKPYAWD